MTQHDRYSSLTDQQLQELHTTSEEFERALRTESAASIEDCLAAASVEIQRYLFEELLAIELQALSLRESYQITDYKARFPDRYLEIDKAVQELSEDWPVSPQINSTVRYQVQGEIARGGMGAILKGRDSQLGRDLAIKVLLDAHRDKPHVVQRFIEEAQISGQLQHPGIAPVYELGQFADNRPFFSMKLVTGETLAKLQADRKDPSVDRGRLLGVFEQVCQTVAYAHSRGVIHRDLKPSNIMVGEFGEVQVMDWGVAKVLSSGGVAGERHPVEIRRIQTHRSESCHASDASRPADWSTQTGSIMGTPAYMPPEQARGDADNMDRRADVFGLGAILCELLTGKPPYVGADTEELYRQALRGELEECTTRLDACGADPDLISLAKYCLEPEPKDRAPDAGVVAERVAGYLQSVELKLHETEMAKADAQVRAEELIRRHKLVFSAAAVIVVLLAAGIVTSGWQAVRAERGAKRARAAEQRSEVEKNRADVILADMYTSQGMLASDRDAPAEAVLWFAAAASQSATADDDSRQKHNLLRARNWIAEAPLPVAAMLAPGNASQLDFQPRGNLLLLRYAITGEVILWPWRGGRRISWAESLTAISAAQFSPDGAFLALGFLSGEAQIRNVSDGQILASIQHQGQIRALAFSPDGQFLAVAGHVARIWDIDAAAFLDPIWKHPQAVTSLLYNRKGNRIISTCSDRLVRVFALEGDQTRNDPLYAPVVHTANTPPALIDEDRFLVTVSGDAELSRWDMATGQAAWDPIPTTPSSLGGVVSSPDGKWFATAGNYGPEIYPADTKQPPVHLGHTNLVTDFAFSPDSTMLLSTGWDSTAQLWSVPGDRPLGQPLSHMANVERCAWSYDGRHVATAQNDGLIRIWRHPAADHSVVLESGWGERPRISSDGRLVAPGVWHEAPSESHHQSIDRLRVLATVDGEPAGADIVLPGDLVDSCVCSDNLGVAAVVSRAEESQLGVWDVATARGRFEPIALPGKPTSIAARPGSHQLAVMCRTGDLLVFDDRTGGRLLQLRHEGWWDTPVRSIQARYTADGKTLVSLVSGDNSTINVRDADTGRTRFGTLRPSVPGSNFQSFDLSADGRLLATITLVKNSAQVWDLTTGLPISEALPHPGDFWGLFSVRFSPDGKHLITSHKDGQVRYWHSESGKLACPPMAHHHETHDAAITPDGQYALTVVRGQPEMHVWELETGRRITPPVQVGANNGEWCQALAITPDGAKALASTWQKHLAIADLEVLLSPSTATAADLALLAELATARRIELGGLSGLTTDQWLAQWILLDERQPGLASSLLIESHLPQAAEKR